MTEIATLERMAALAYGTMVNVKAVFWAHVPTANKAPISKNHGSTLRENARFDDFLWWRGANVRSAMPSARSMIIEAKIGVAATEAILSKLALTLKIAATARMYNVALCSRSRRYIDTIDSPKEFQCKMYEPI